MKTRFIQIVCTAALMLCAAGCSIEPTYYSQVSPDTFFDSKEHVYQRFARPFEHWVTQVAPFWSSFTYASTIGTDEAITPNRNGDWFDEGYYLNFYKHLYTPGTTGPGDDIWNAYSTGVAHVLSVKKDFAENIDFDALGFTAEERQWMESQLDALMAYFYLQGLDGFGGVPLYTSNDEGLKARSTDRETFSFIERLLKDALPNLPVKKQGEAEQGYISQGAAATLLARLYLNAGAYIGEEMYDEAEQVCKDILGGTYGYYAQAGSYQEIFGYTNATCPEHIWDAMSEPGKRQLEGMYYYSMHYTADTYFDNLPLAFYNGVCLVPSQDMYGKHYLREAGNLGGPFKLGSPYDKFNDRDLRKQNYVYKGGGQYEGMFICGRMINPLTGAASTYDGSREYHKGDTVTIVDCIAQLAPDGVNEDGTTKVRYPNGRKEGGNFGEENSGVRWVKFAPIPNEADNALYASAEIPYLRLTEVQYMLAECRYRAGDKSEAARLINEVRARYFDAVDPDPVTADNLDDYRFLDELLIEFLAEGHRRTDLIRWGKFTTEAWWDHPADGPAKAYLNRFPIPQSVRNANGLIDQNPNYGELAAD
jgi:hypothetical protein